MLLALWQRRTCEEAHELVPVWPGLGVVAVAAPVAGGVAGSGRPPLDAAGAVHRGTEELGVIVQRE